MQHHQAINAKMTRHDSPENRCTLSSTAQMTQDLSSESTSDCVVRDSKACIRRLEAVNQDPEDEDIVPPAYLRVKLTAKREHSVDALIDEGVDFNILTYEAWTLLGQPELTLTDATLNPYRGHPQTLLGKCRILVTIETESLPVLFHVPPNSENCGKEILLRGPFKRSTKCEADYIAQRIHLTLPRVRIIMTFSKGDLIKPQGKDKEQSNIAWTPSNGSKELLEELIQA